MNMTHNKALQPTDPPRFARQAAAELERYES